MALWPPLRQFCETQRCEGFGLTFEKSARTSISMLADHARDLCRFSHVLQRSRHASVATPDAAIWRSTSGQAGPTCKPFAFSIRHALYETRGLKGLNMRKRYLITGGAGFVGSHVVAALLDKGQDCVVLDDLSTGHRDALLPGARLVEGDLADAALLERTVADGPWDAVFHFASLSLVGDSMREPYSYLLKNVGNGIRLIEACTRHGVPRFVFSSTAALFGAPVHGLIDEETSVDPGSPYGESKWMQERALHWAYQVHGMRSACLRYFNAAGSDRHGLIGEDHRPESHLIPLVIDAALGRRPALEIYGQDFATPDGTAIRDYIHVSDLADAHIRILDHLEAGSVAYNLGTGRGHSVMDVIASVEQVIGHKVPWLLGNRRVGDPPVLVASAAKMRAKTGWAPAICDLRAIVQTALQWRESHPAGYSA